VGHFLPARFGQHRFNRLQGLLKNLELDLLLADLAVERRDAGLRP